MKLEQTNEPLADYNLLKSDDVNTTENIVTSMYCEHTLEPLKGDRVKAKLNAVKGEKFNFGFLTYGVNAKIQLPPLFNCYHVNITLSGESYIKNRYGSKLKTNAMKSGAILLPDREYDVIWEENTSQYAFKFYHEELEKHLAMLIGESVNSPIDFDTIFNLNNSIGQGLIRACTLLQTEWEQNNILTTSPFARRHLESYVMTSFLLTVKNPYSERLLVDYNTKDLNKALVRKAINYIEENIHELPSLADITSHTKVSARTLQLAFKRYLNISPMQYVQNIRIQRAHEHIKLARYTNEKITDIAMQWGFYNPGRFAKIYKQQYGCSPKDSLLN